MTRIDRERLMSVEHCETGNNKACLAYDDLQSVWFYQYVNLVTVEFFVIQIMEIVCKK